MLPDVIHEKNKQIYEKEKSDNVKEAIVHLCTAVWDPLYHLNLESVFYYNLVGHKIVRCTK